NGSAPYFNIAGGYRWFGIDAQYFDFCSGKGNATRFNTVGFRKIHSRLSGSIGWAVGCQYVEALVVPIHRYSSRNGYLGYSRTGFAVNNYIAIANWSVGIGCKYRYGSSGCSYTTCSFINRFGIKSTCALICDKSIASHFEAVSIYQSIVPVYGNSVRNRHRKCCEISCTVKRHIPITKW